jgi:hypothetical protein
MDALLLRGWAVLPGESLTTALAGWQHHGPADLPIGQWRVIQPVDADQPIGTASRLVLIPADAEVDVMPGSQGIPSAPPPGIEPARVRLVGDQVLVMDARCWLRLIRSAGEIATWEQI